MGAGIERVLIVEDDPRLRAVLEEVVGAHAGEVRGAGTVHDGLELLRAWRPNLLLLDFRLPDGDAIELLREARDLSPTATVIALSAYAAPTDAFELGALGVRAYLPKPLDLAALEHAIEQALDTPPDVLAHVRQAVGHVALQDLERDVRHVMVEEAVSRTDGNRRGAARLLRISREMLQHVLRNQTD